MRNKWFLIILAALMVGGGVWFFSNSGHQRDGSPSALYYCPMHPQVTSDRPGECPICHMSLVKREGKEPAKTASAEQIRQQMTNICYLHKCPHSINGKPCPMMVLAKPGEKITCPICGTHVAGKPVTRERKILYWTDPMIPDYQSDHPGKSPMGMELVPVYEEDEAVLTAGSYVPPEGYEPILLSPEKRQTIGLRTSPAEIRPLVKTIRTVGTVARDPDLYQAQAEYIQAVQAYQRARDSSIPEVTEQAQRLVESTKIRLRYLGLSEELINEMADWKEPERGLLFAQPGDSVWVYAQIYEYELPLIKINQKIVADVSALGGEKFEGTIRAIDPSVGAQTRTTRIRAKIEDPQGHLRPDMYVNVTIEIDLGQTLTVPVEAVFNTGKQQIVFVDKGEGVLEPREVVLGAKTEDYYEIKKGIEAGEQVVTSGNFLIDSESRLKAALETMSGGGGHSHGQ